MGPDTRAVSACSDVRLDGVPERSQRFAPAVLWLHHDAGRSVGSQHLRDEEADRAAAEDDAERSLARHLPHRVRGGRAGVDERGG
ncbi:MAG: hypothetical protein M3Q31_12930 [Actinomycetota bacterium]|nr:hypothetical protein [Actinomycetota bacterium]